MHMRITTARATPDNIPRIERIIQESLLPAARRQEGFQALIVSSSPEDRKVVVMTLWETEEHMLRSEEGGYLQEQISKVVTLLSGPPETDRLRVVFMS